MHLFALKTLYIGGLKETFDFSKGVIYLFALKSMQRWFHKVLMYHMTDALFNPYFAIEKIGML